jgi:hypothetical protein
LSAAHQKAAGSGVAHEECSILRKEKRWKGRFQGLEAHFRHLNSHSKPALKCDSARHFEINTPLSPLRNRASNSLRFSNHLFTKSPKPDSFEIGKKSKNRKLSSFGHASAPHNKKEITTTLSENSCHGLIT